MFSGVLEENTMAERRLRSVILEGKAMRKRLGGDEIRLEEVVRRRGERIGGWGDDETAIARARNSSGG